MSQIEQEAQASTASKLTLESKLVDLVDWLGERTEAMERLVPMSKAWDMLLESDRTHLIAIQRNIEDQQSEMAALFATLPAMTNSDMARYCRELFARYDRLSREVVGNVYAAASRRLD